jgi:mannose-6-phosphate isomerase-like protein (cupin superfamily)
VKLFSLEESPFEPVSHDPQLKKKVLARDPLPSLLHVSHIVLPRGSAASEHSHADFAEVFYCIRGEAVFLVEGKEVFVREGNLLIVEPGELHCITRIVKELELLYFHIAMKS